MPKMKWFPVPTKYTTLGGAKRALPSIKRAGASKIKIVKVGRGYKIFFRF